MEPYHFTCYPAMKSVYQAEESYYPFSLYRIGNTNTSYRGERVNGIPISCDKNNLLKSFNFFTDVRSLVCSRFVKSSSHIHLFPVSLSLSLSLSPSFFFSLTSLFLVLFLNPLYWRLHTLFQDVKSFTWLSTLFLFFFPKIFPRNSLISFARIVCPFIRGIFGGSYDILVTYFFSFASYSSAPFSVITVPLRRVCHPSRFVENEY